MNYIRYAKPYPPMPSRGGDYQGSCRSIIAHDGGWLCTRESDHTGPHCAGNTRGECMASWDNE